MLVYTVAEVREQVKAWKNQGLTVGFVPTMGALHEGHLSLIRASFEKCDKTVVSIFVNPTQFGPAEDFDKYPRTLEEDVKLCAGVNLIFAPGVDEMYAPSPFTTVMPPFEYIDKLCAKSRPGHFDGVCTVVSKFFNIVQPDFAFFGEKDMQQLVIIKKMVRDLNIPVEITGCPIVRDENGLALSSRNKYLTPQQKQEASELNKVLKNIKMCYNNGVTDIKALSETALYLSGLEYLEFRDKDDLEEKMQADSNTIVFIAAKIGQVRLIDNVKLM